MDRSAGRRFESTDAPSGRAAAGDVVPLQAGDDDLTFRHLVALAADALAAPMAFVAFAVHGRHFVRAQHGIDGPLKPADEIVPLGLLDGGEPRVMRDARGEGDIPAAAALGARFIVSMPIGDEQGRVVGALCVMDTRPRPHGLDDREHRLLTRLAALAGACRVRRAVSGEDRLQTVFSRAMVGILFRDPEDRVLMVNDHFCALVGRTADELEGMPMQAFTHPGDVAESLAMMQRHRESREPYQIEKRYLRPDGSLVWCAVHVSFVIDEQGDIRSTIAVANDITARRQAERALRESEEHHRWSVELSPQIPWTAEPDGAVEEVGPLWCELTGYTAQQAQGEGWLLALHPEDIDRTLRDWHRALRSGDPVDVEYRVGTRAGDYRWMRARAAPRRDPDGTILRWYGTLEDIHDRRLAKIELADSEERLRLAVQSARLGIWDYDVASGQRRWSDEFRAMLGLPIDALPIDDLTRSLVYREDRQALQQVIDAAATADGPRHFEVVMRIRRADTGALRWLKSMGWKTLSPSGELSRVIVTFQDITEERGADERIRWAATHDPLTLLLNRTSLQDELDRTVRRSKASGERFALLLFDVDDLKRTNDTLGHDAGDALLRTFAGRLVAAAPRRATIGRLGGDEFALIMPGIGSAAALDTLAAALIKALRKPFLHESRVLDCGASIGASIFPDHGDEAVELLKSADLALYAAKAGGRGRMTRFQPEMRADMQLRSSMISMAREAIRHDMIVPFYQPKIDLRTRRIVGFEALLRWCDPRGGIQAPDTIAAAFDDPDLAVAITDRMLELVTADLRRWLDQGCAVVNVALNASAADFKFDNLAERVLDRLARCDIPTACLEIEVTETVFLGRGADYAERALRLFSERGIRIALDDFGTGYASLSHLKQYPVDILKIDKSFVSNLGESPDDAAIVDAVVNLGRSLGLAVVAEGIETRAQADHLLDRGCTIGQGFLFGRPQAAADIEDMLRTGMWEGPGG